jgi:formate dehydrogenase major subunit
VVNEMMYILGRVNKYGKVEELTQEVSKAVPEYVDLFKKEGLVYWPIGEPEVLYTKGFNFENGKAKLTVVSDGKLFDKRESTDFVEKEFAKVLEKI